MIYDLIAPIYDAINSEIDYKSWAEYIDNNVKKLNRNGDADLGLDLGCGTGSMTFALSALGYDMTGIDCSDEMLDLARRRAATENKGKDILWLSQDIRAFELYGTVDLAVAALDTLNHLSTPADFKKTLALVHNYLRPDGLFFFDLNGKGKFERAYANETYVMREGGDVCVWENDYDERTRLCDFYITLFHREADGRYRMEEDVQRERMYPIRTVEKYLSEAGFELIAVDRDFDGNEADDDCERVYFIARAIKEETL